MTSRENEINEQAEAFNQKHPQVAKLFVRFALQAIGRGFCHYSAKSIFERIRWETDQADVDGKSTFKLNNNYTCWYSRRFMEVYPQHAGFFRTRTRISAEEPATNMPPLTPHHFEGAPRG